jgi:SAM-dependent methyltransferase
MQGFAKLGLRLAGGNAGPQRGFRRQRGERRSEAQLREHYAIERELAERLRTASRAERRTLYTELYDELLRRVPHHPLLKDNYREAQGREVDRQFGFLRRFLRPDANYMEVGAGDCALALKVAGLVKQVYVIEVSEEITRTVKAPPNFTLIISDGCSVPLPEGAVDVAFSNQLMEHLHPDDAEEQLRNIYRALAAGGRYICVTPNRLYGPRDISEHFDEVATGFHLREYSAREIRRLFLETGFSRVDFYAGARGWFVRCPSWIVAALEGALGTLPHRPRKAIADFAPVRALLGLRVVASK